MLERSVHFLNIGCLILIAGCGAPSPATPDGGDAGDTSTPQCVLTAPTLTTGALVADGTLLRDEHGRVVWLRGVDAGGRSKWAPYVPFEYQGDPDFDGKLAAYMDHLASWGINVVRMPFIWEAVEPQQGQDDEDYLTRYGKMIDAAFARGIRVLVDCHQDVYSSVFSGDGFPVWTLGTIPHGMAHHDDPNWYQQYFDDMGPVTAAFDHFWKNGDGVQDDFAAMWGVMATRFGARPGAFGFEVINEPGWGASGLNDMELNLLPPLLERVGKIIQAAAPSALVFQGGASTDSVSARIGFPDPSLTGFVYAPHFYDLEVFKGETYGDQTQLDNAITSSVAATTKRDRPTFFGEVGGKDTSPDLAIYYRDLFDHFDAAQVHATVWEASFTDEPWNAEGFSLTDGAGTDDSAVAQLIRAYPRAIDGQIDSFMWDADAYTADLEISQAGKGVSEVYLPTRYVGEKPKITLTGGCWSFDSASGKLLLQASGTTMSLKVSPQP